MVAGGRHSSIKPLGVQSGRLIVLGGERHANQVRQAPGLHLFHDPGAMDLDGPGADIE